MTNPLRCDKIKKRDERQEGSKTDNTYFVTAWCGIPARYLSRESVLTAKGCGLTVLPGDYGREKNLDALDLFAECGMKLMVSDSRIAESIRCPDKADELLRQVVADYASHPALHSYYVTDEPGCGDFPALSAVMQKLSELDPRHIGYINIFPNYANTRQLGCGDYREHVTRYLDEVRPPLLSYDHYHFMCHEQRDISSVTLGDERSDDIYRDAHRTEDRAGFFDNFEIIRREALKRNTPYMLIVLLTAHGGYRDLTEGEIRWEVCQSLAYGVSAMSYFTYWTPAYEPVWRMREGIVSDTGKPLRHYANVRAVNAETALLGQKIASLRSRAVFHVGEEPKETVVFFPAEGYSGLRSVRGGRFTLGFFESGEIFLANKDFSAPAATVLTPDSGKSVELFDRGSGEWKAAGDRLELSPGGGELIRIK